MTSGTPGTEISDSRQLLPGLLALLLIFFTIGAITQLALGEFPDRLDGDMLAHSQADYSPDPQDGPLFLPLDPRIIQEVAGDERDLRLTPTGQPAALLATPSFIAELPEAPPLPATTSTPPTTVTSSPTATPNATRESPTATTTPRPTATASPTPPPTPTASAIPFVLPSPTPTATSTATAPPPSPTSAPPQPPGNTKTPTPTLTATTTPGPNATNPATATPSPTATAPGTETPTLTPTSTPTTGITLTPKVTASPTTTPAPSSTPTTPAPSSTPTTIPTSTTGASPTATNTPIPPTLSPTPSPTYTPASFLPLQPKLECVRVESDGSYTAIFGYLNVNQFAINVPIGGGNSFSPPPASRGQPTVFQHGRHHAVFSVNFDGSPLSWTLYGHTVTASNDTSACD